MVLIDLLGHGRSDKPTQTAKYRIDGYAEQMIGLLDHLGLASMTLGDARCAGRVVAGGRREPVRRDRAPGASAGLGAGDAGD